MRGIEGHKSPAFQTKPAEGSIQSWGESLGELRLGIGLEEPNSVSE